MSPGIGFLIALLWTCGLIWLLVHALTAPEKKDEP